VTKRKPTIYRVDANHGVALEGGTMAGPGQLVAFTAALSEHDQGLVDDGHLVPFEGDVPEGDGGVEPSPTIPDEVSGEQTTGEGGE
jgi:hypothetical protein